MYSRSLPSKLHRPALGRLVIPRARLLHSLDAGLDSKVMLISAPAGFGKSTLASQWLEQLAEARIEPDADGSCCVVWLSLDAGDNNLSQFLFSLSAAIENAYPATCRALTALLREQASVSVERLADTLAACIARVPGPLVTVLDDVHFVDDPAIFVCLERVVQHSPPGFHLLLITRVDPPLPLNRWRAQGALHEVRLHELSFTLAETNVFLQKQLDMPVDEELASVLHRRTEGWPVGLRLAAIALRNHRDPGEFAARFEATESRFVADYLVDEVLEQQTPAMQRFLMFTSILNGLCTGLCVAVVETDEAGARAAIEYLGRANLFLVELDPSSAQCNWHRYHHQFQSMLQSRLYERYDEQTVVSLHRKAAAWLAVHDSAAEALRHLIAVHDYEAAADLIEERRVSALNEQRFHELESWFELIPSSIIRQRPALLACQAWLFHYRLENAASLTAVRRQIKRPIRLVAQRPWLHTAQRRRAALLIQEDVGAITQDHLIPTLAVAQDRYQIPHRPARHKYRRLFAQHLRRQRFQSNDRRVLSIDIIPDLCRRHSLSHRLSRMGDSIAAQVNGLPCCTHDSLLGIAFDAL